jgi:hypothetical protein
MYSLLMGLALFGQVEIGVPPAPAAELPVVPASESAEEMRSWLLARLVLDQSFDERKSAEAKRLLSTMDERQLKALVAAYQERTTKPAATTKTPLDSNQQQALDQAKLNLQQAEAYRDHLTREYDRRILQGQMTQNLVYQNILNNQMAMYRNNGLYTFGGINLAPVGFGGMGYGMLNYGGWGIGAPVYGGTFYGAPGWW